MRGYITGQNRNSIWSIINTCMIYVVPVNFTAKDILSNYRVSKCYVWFKLNFYGNVNEFKYYKPEN